MQKIILLSTFLTLVAGCVSQPNVHAAASAKPKVILIIGDGIDDHQITIGRNYLVGGTGRLVLDGMPYRGAVQVQAVAERDLGIPDYVGDSASGPTAMASGIVTSIGRIGTTAQTDRDVPNIMELARSAGFGTGIVTTARVTDASPASFVAHISNRGIGYAANDSPHWEEHSGVQVPLYASGPAAQKLPQFLRQADIFDIAATHLGLSESWPGQ